MSNPSCKQAAVCHPLTVPAAPAKAPSASVTPMRRVREIACDLPALTFGQLTMLKRVGTPLSATIRKVGPGYMIEVEVGPRRWVLISTHRKTPRVFLRLDGAARAVSRLNAQAVALELGDQPRQSPSAPSSSNEVT
ncbi:MAG: hypothetical protein NVS9B10_26350 [Nevskia sp.]